MDDAQTSHLFVLQDIGVGRLRILGGRQGQCLDIGGGRGGARGPNS